MPDREKVIKGLECCVDYPEKWADDCGKHGCPYVKNERTCITDLQRDALSLLKAQEAVMVEERADTNTINCPKCGQQFARIGRDKSIYLDTDEEPNYCPKCGQAVKWE